MHKKSVVISVGLVLLVAVVAFGIFQLFALYNRPLAAPLALPTAAAPAAAPTATQSTVLLPAVVAQAGATATPAAPAPVCGNTGSTLLLFTGADFSAGVPPLGADSVRLIQIDYDALTIKVIAFPRDLLLNTAGLADLNMPQQRLGLAYFYRKEATKDTEQKKIIAATSLLAQTLSEVFAVRPDHYITLQLNSVAGMVDTVGGVEVTVPQAFTNERKVTFPAGKQTLTGALTAEYVRTLNTGGEPARLARQNQVIQALQDKLLSLGILPKVPALLDQFNTAITTDYSPRQMVDLACMLDKVGKDKIEFKEIIAAPLVTPGQAGALIPNVPAIKAFLVEQLKTN